MSNRHQRYQYNIGDVVWVKLRTLWWPGVVSGEDSVPAEAIRHLKNRPVAIVRFFCETTYDIVKNAKLICPYDCEKKFNYIQKGLVAFRKDYDYAIKFPSDVQLAEERTGGDVNMFYRDDEFTLRKIDEKTAKLLAEQRKERGDPMPGEDIDTSSDSGSYISYRSESEIPGIMARIEADNAREEEERRERLQMEKVIDEMQFTDQMKLIEEINRIDAEYNKAKEKFERNILLGCSHQLETLRKQKLKREQELQKQLQAQRDLQNQVKLQRRLQLQKQQEGQPIPSRSSLPSTSRLDTSEEEQAGASGSAAQPQPSTSSSSRLSMPLTSKEKKSRPKETFKKPLPSPAKGSTVVSKNPIPSSSGATHLYKYPIEKSKHPPSSSSSDKSEKSHIKLGDLSDACLCIPYRRPIPSVPAPVRTPPKQNGNRKKPGRRKKKNQPPSPPAPGTSRIKGESTIHIMDIYRDVFERIYARNRDLRDPNIPLPLYLRPESIRRPKKPVPPPMPPSGKMHPIPQKVGEYKCHLCKYSCDRQNNIVAHIRLHNFGKSLKVMARKIFLKYLTNVMLDINETITVVASEDEEEENATAPPRPDEDVSFVEYSIDCDADSDDSNAPPVNRQIPNNSLAIKTVPIFKKIPRDTVEEVPTTSRQAILETRQAINRSKRSTLPSETTDQSSVDRNMPSTSKAANRESPKAANEQQPELDENIEEVNRDLPSTSKIIILENREILKARPSVENIEIQQPQQSGENVEELNRDMPSTSKIIILENIEIQQPQQSGENVEEVNRDMPSASSEPIIVSATSTENLELEKQPQQSDANVEENNDIPSTSKIIILENREILKARPSVENMEIQQPQQSDVNVEEVNRDMPSTSKIIIFENKEIQQSQPSDVNVEEVNRDMASTSKIIILENIEIQKPQQSGENVEEINRDVPSTSRGAIRKTTTSDESKKSEKQPQQSDVNLEEINRDMPSTSKGAIRKTTTSAGNKKSEKQPQQSDANKGDDVDSDGSSVISNNSSEHELILDKILRLIPREFIEAEKRTILGMPPLPLINMPIRRACVRSKPIRYIPPWQQGGIELPLHYLPPRPQLILPFPIMLPSKRRKRPQQKKQQSQQQQPQSQQQQEQSQQQTQQEQSSQQPQKSEQPKRPQQSKAQQIKRPQQPKQLKRPQQSQQPTQSPLTKRPQQSQQIKRPQQSQQIKRPQQSQQIKRPQQSQQSSQRPQKPLSSKKRSYPIKKQIKLTTTTAQDKTDNVIVGEILKDWDDEDSTNNPTPSTSRQNIIAQQPSRLENAIGMLRRPVHDDDDEDPQLISPQRKIRNIPKKDRNRLVSVPTTSKSNDDIIEVADDDIIIIEDNEIRVYERNKPSTSKKTDDKEDNTSSNDTNKSTQVNVSHSDDSDDQNTTDDDQVKLDKSVNKLKESEFENDISQPIGISTEENYNNKNEDNNTIQILENIQIVPSKTFVQLNTNNNDSIIVESITNNDKKLVEEIVEKINEVNESIIEKNINQSNDIVIKLNENIECSSSSNNIEMTEEIEENIKENVLVVPLLDLNKNIDKEINSADNECEINSANIETNTEPAFIENVVEESSENISQSREILKNITDNILETENITTELSEKIIEQSENILETENITKELSEKIIEQSENILETENITKELSEKMIELSENILETENITKELSEKIIEQSENIEESTESLSNLEENLTDNQKENLITDKTNDYDEKNKEEIPLYRESSLDIAIRDLITPFEPKKKLPSARKGTKQRGEIQSIRKSSRKSDNIYKILGREITTPSPSSANMTTNENDFNQQIHSTSSTMEDSSNSATESIQKPTGGGKGRRSKKNLEKDISIEQVKMTEEGDIEVINSSNKNESEENIIIEQSVEKEIIEKESSNIIVPKKLTKTLKKGISKDEIEAQQQQHEDKEITEKVSRKLRNNKQDDGRRKSCEKEEIPKIIIKSPKNSNENPKIIRKMSPDKYLQESSPKKIPKIILKNIESDKSLSTILITSTTIDIPTTSTSIKSIDDIIVEENKEIITVQQKSAISCFDFNEDEDDNEIILTPLNKLKKKYMSPPDKFKDDIDNKKIKEIERKDQLFTTEIENILNITKVPELKKIEMTGGETSIVVTKASTSADTTSQISVPTSSSFDGNTQDVKGLPIKERGKRFFKSRNRKIDENIITTNTTVPTTTDSINSKEIRNKNLIQDKSISNIHTSGDNIVEELKTHNNDILLATEPTSINIINISDKSDNIMKDLGKSSTMQNIDETNLLTKTTSENELFIAETLLSFPNTVTETTSTLKNLENINVKLQNLKDDQKQQQIENKPITENLKQPIQEKRTQIRVKSLEKLNQQFEDSLLQEKDIGKPIELIKSNLPVEHITRRRRSHLKITPRKRILQQPVKLETTTTMNEPIAADIMKVDESTKSDDNLNVSTEKNIADSLLDTLVSESKISEIKIDNNKIIEEKNLNTVQVTEISTNKTGNDNLIPIIKTKDTIEAENVTKQYEESFVEKYMKDSRMFDELSSQTEKIEKQLNKSEKIIGDNKNENIEINLPQISLELVDSDKVMNPIISESSPNTVSSTENIKNKNSEIDNEQNLPTSSSSSIKLTSSTQSISDIRSFRPRRKTSNKRSPSFSSEYPSNRRLSTECQIDVESKIIENIVDRTAVTDESKTIVTSLMQIPNSTITTTTIVQQSDNNKLDILKPTDKLNIDTTVEQSDQQHQLSPTIEKIQINVDLANPLTTQIAQILASNNSITKTTDDLPLTTSPAVTKLSVLGQGRSATIKRKSTIEEEIPMFLIEKTKAVIEQGDVAPPQPLEKIQKTAAATTTGLKSSMKLSTTTTGTSFGQQKVITGEESEISVSPINKIPSSLLQFPQTNKNTLGSGKLIITQLRDTSLQGKSEPKQEQSDMSNIFDFTNMPIFIANESTLPYVVTTSSTPTISQPVSLSINTTSTITSSSTTIVKRQGRGRPRKIYQTTTTTPITTLTTSIPKYTSTSQQTFNKPLSKNLISHTTQLENNNNSNILNYPNTHQTHTQQILDSQNYNLLHSANNNSGTGKEVGIDSKGNRFILIKHGNSQKMVKQSISSNVSSSTIPTDINNTQFTTNQIQSTDVTNINVISSEVILPPNTIKNQTTTTTNRLATKRINQQVEQQQSSHQPAEKKRNLLTQSGQFIITSKGAIIQSQNIQPITTDCISSDITTGQLQSHITGDSTTSSDMNQQQQLFIESTNHIQQQVPPLTKGKMTTMYQQQRGRKRKNDNVMLCYNENQLDMPPLTPIQQNSPSTSSDLTNFSSQQQHHEQDIKKLKLLEKQQEIENIKNQLQKQISPTHSIETVTNQLVSDIDNTNLSITSTQNIGDDELQTNKIMAVPANHFGIPGSAYYLCSQTSDGDYLPIDSQKLYLDPDVNQLVPLACLSKNALATVLATEEEAEIASAQHTAIVLQTDDTDALIEETTELDEDEIGGKHNVEVQFIAAQQQVVEQQKIEKTVLIEQTTNNQYIIESNVGGGTVEQITDNIVGATVGATATASTDSVVDNIICLDIDDNQQQVIAIDESDVITDITCNNNTNIPASTTSSAITPVAAENLLTAEDVSGFLGSDQSIVINVDGQQLILDQQSFLALAATGGESAQLETAEGQTYILSREFLAALGIGGGVVNSDDTSNINNIDGTDDTTQILLHGNSELTGTNHDILAAALAGTEVYYQQQQDNDLMNLQIETSNGIVQQLVGEETLTFQHLTPPVTAQTNETSALLTQPPIMSALEVPSNTKKLKTNKIYNNKSTNELTIQHDGTIISNINTNDRLLTTVPPQNLDDCIAFIGVSTQSSTVPTSLELPITITNPAIAPPKSSTNPIDDTIFNTKCLGVPTSTIGSIIAGSSSSSSSQISPHLISCNGEQELQYELFTTTQTTSQQQQQQKSTTNNNSQSDDVFQTNFDDPTR